MNPESSFNKPSQNQNSIENKSNLKQKIISKIYSSLSAFANQTYNESSTLETDEQDNQINYPKLREYFEDLIFAVKNLDRSSQEYTSFVSFERSMNLPKNQNYKNALTDKFFQVLNQPNSSDRQDMAVLSTFLVFITKVNKTMEKVEPKESTPITKSEAA